MGNSCFVEFEVNDAKRFKPLCRVFEALKQEKQKQITRWKEEQIDQDEDSEESFGDNHKWLELLDEQAKAYFWWPSKEEVAAHFQQWFATPLPERWTDPKLKKEWTFGALIEAFKNGEYELISCEMKGSEVAILEFEPLAFPYGGTGCMKALVEAFGFHVVGEDDGTGYVLY